MRVSVKRKRVKSLKSFKLYVRQSASKNYFIIFNFFCIFEKSPLIALTFFPKIPDTKNEASPGNFRNGTDNPGPGPKLCMVFLNPNNLMYDF